MLCYFYPAPFIQIFGSRKVRNGSVQLAGDAKVMCIFYWKQPVAGIISFVLAILINVLFAGRFRKFIIAFYRRYQHQFMGVETHLSLAVQANTVFEIKRIVAVTACI